MKTKHRVLWNVGIKETELSWAARECDYHVDTNCELCKEQTSLLPLLITDFLWWISSPLACDQSCKSCGPNSPRCLTCAEKTVLHDGKCIAECPGGYYAEATGRCKGKTWAIIVIIVIIKKGLTLLTTLGTICYSLGNLYIWWENDKWKGMAFSLWNLRVFGVGVGGGR